MQWKVFYVSKHWTFQDLILKFSDSCEIRHSDIFCCESIHNKVDPWRDSTREVYSDDERRIHVTYIRDSQYAKSI